MLNVWCLDLTNHRRTGRHKFGEEASVSISKLLYFKTVPKVTNPHSATESILIFSFRSSDCSPKLILFIIWFQIFSVHIKREMIAPFTKCYCYYYYYYYNKNNSSKVKWCHFISGLSHVLKKNYLLVHFNKHSDFPYSYWSQI